MNQGERPNVNLAISIQDHHAVGHLLLNLFFSMNCPSILND